MIEIKNIHIVYDNNEILKNENLEIPNHSLVGISGNSGSGKSSLFYIIGLISKMKGHEYIFNDEQISLDDDDLISYIRKEKIGFIFQEKNLHDYLSIEDNLKIYAYISGHEYFRDEAESLLKKVHIDIDMSTQVGTLSGGEKQRIAIACALIKKPELIIADEPTSSLDRHNTEMIMKVFKEIAKDGKMIIIASHNQDILKQCDYLYYIKDKRLVLENKIPDENKISLEKFSKRPNPSLYTFYKWYSHFEFGKSKSSKFIMILLSALMIMACVISLFIKDDIISLYERDINRIGLKEVLVKNENSVISEQGFHLLKEVDGQQNIDYVHYVMVDHFIQDGHKNDIGVTIVPYFPYQKDNFVLEEEYQDGDVYLSYSLAQKMNLNKNKEIIVNDSMLDKTSFKIKGYLKRDSRLLQAEGELIMYIPYAYINADTASNRVLINMSHFKYLDGISDRIKTINPSFEVILSDANYVSQISIMNLMNENLDNFVYVLSSTLILLLLAINYNAIHNQRYEIAVLRANGLSHKELAKLILYITFKNIIKTLGIIVILLFIGESIALAYKIHLISLDMLFFLVIFIMIIYFLPCVTMILYATKLSIEKLLRF